MLCAAPYADCVANGVTENCSEFSATCTATVSDYNRCLADSVDALGVLPPCSSLTRA